jgi:hypothetical protein
MRPAGGILSESFQSNHPFGFVGINGIPNRLTDLDGAFVDELPRSVGNVVLTGYYGPAA